MTSKRGGDTIKLYFVTGNQGKLAEVRKVFEPLGIEIEQMTGGYPELQVNGVDEVVDFGLRWLFEKHGRPVIIDDSGLFVDALAGFPGVYSAYVYKTVGLDGVLKLMDGRQNRAARFLCCAGFIDAEGNIKTAQGVSEGSLIHEQRGSLGFGYDPIFVPAGHERTFAEMDILEKNKLSHRGKAFERLAEIIGGEL